MAMVIITKQSHQVTVSVICVCLLQAVQAIQISEIMYHPPTNEDQNEWIELYNEAPSRRDIGQWAFTDGIEYVFPEDTVMEPGEYLVVASDPNTLKTVYGITRAFGPFERRLSNAGEHIVLSDKFGAAMVELSYQDQNPWPLAPDGTGHSLTKDRLRGNPMDPANWRSSRLIGGTPGQANGVEAPVWTETVIEVGDQWRYFKGRLAPSLDPNEWTTIDYDDSGTDWLTGPTGIGYGDDDDATVLSDMHYNYLSVYCRKEFSLETVEHIQQILLTLDYDDSFIAYLNGVEAVRDNMPSGIITHATQSTSSREADGGRIYDLTHLKNLLSEINVLAIQVHNTQISSSDLSCIPKLSLVCSIDQTPVDRIPIRINEIHSFTKDVQYIELYNPGNNPFSLDGYYLSNDPGVLDLFKIPADTLIEAESYLCFEATQLGFVLDITDSTILLTNPSLDSVIDAHSAHPGKPEWSVGRWPNGSNTWEQMPPTKAQPNQSEPKPLIIINEIMYNPPSNQDADEYIELYNAGNQTINLGQWQLTGGIDYTFPESAVIEPGSYVVIAKDRDQLIARYTLASEQVFGNYEGKLSNNNDTIILRDGYTTVIDQVHYWESGHWPCYADGYGSSLELTDPLQDNSNYQAWKASDETDKAAWTFIQYQGLLNPQPDAHEHEIQFNLMGPGVTLIDDIRLTVGNTEYLGNGGFEQGLNKWIIMGTHRESHLITTDAKEGTYCLKIVADGDGDTGANHIEKDCDRPVPAGIGTLSFWAKWQYGSPILVTRFWSEDMPETTHLPIPESTGTPGMVNTAYESNSGPVFSEMSHTPVVPKPADTVIVRSRIQDPDGIESVSVYYKADSQLQFAFKTMQDNGLFPDEIEADGLYSAQLPAQNNGETIAFYLLATDRTGIHRSWPQDTSRPAHYRVDATGWVSPFQTYRIITTATEEADLYSSPHMSNAIRNCTFIYNEQDVYYNCGIKLIGSSFHRRDNRNPAYTGHKIIFNSDEKLNGVKRQARVDFMSNAGYRERLNYDLLRKMGHPSTLTEWVLVRVNDHDYGINEDMSSPNKRYIQTFYPDASDGELFELMPHFYYTDDVDDYFPSHNAPKWDWAYRGPDKDPYRWYLRIRNHDIQDDYTNIIDAVQVFSQIPNIPFSTIEQHFDVIQNVGMLAIRAVNSNTDFKGNKNCYLYAPSSTQKWQWLAWDCEASFGNTSLNLWTSFVTPVETFLRFGRNRHDYLNIIHNYINSYFTNDYLDPWIDHYYSIAGGLSTTSAKNFVRNRRNYINGILAPYTEPNVTFLLTGHYADPTAEGKSLLSGLAPVNTSWILVNDKLYWLDWQDETHWTALIDSPTDLNFTIEFLDYYQMSLCVIGSAVNREPGPRG